MAAGYTMTIDGKPVKGSKSVGVINPATGKSSPRFRIAAKPNSTRPSTPHRRRSPAGAAISKRAARSSTNAPPRCRPPEGLAKTLTLEQGKPLAKAAEELMGTAMWCAYTASLEMPIEVLQDTPQGKSKSSASRSASSPRSPRGTTR